MSDLNLSGSAVRQIHRFGREMERFARDLESGRMTLEEFNALYPPGVAKVRCIAGVQPVPVNGSRTRGLRSGYFRMALRDGTFGYFQRRTDDCLQAAMASCAQIPVSLVPDLKLDQQRLAGRDAEEIELANWQKIGAFMEQRAVRLGLHPLLPSSGRWIGVVPSDEGMYADHCLLMHGGMCCSIRAFPCRRARTSRSATTTISTLSTESPSRGRPWQLQ